MKAARRYILSVVVLIFVGIPLLTSQAVTSSLSQPPSPVAVSHGFGSVRDDGRDRPDTASGAMDVYGNEVTEAVAQYTVDPGGSLYELHSPQTELPRLGTPKT